ncbi:MAG: hypothetical protein H6Q71_2522 [Firmicutes bacterium]|jgi:hypothetical protein|nr:hypothetical protein [Bacillota bacterium]
MSDPYSRNMFGQFNPYFAKRQTTGTLAVVLDGTFDDRGLELISPSSRAVKTSEIHELILSDEDTGPGKRVNRIAYVGFVEINRGGVIIVGDSVRTDETVIGTVAGFDETHMPNHLNIVLAGNRKTGRELQLSVENAITIG